MNHTQVKINDVSGFSVIVMFTWLGAWEYSYGEGNFYFYFLK